MRFRNKTAQNNHNMFTLLQQCYIIKIKIIQEKHSKIKRNPQWKYKHNTKQYEHRKTQENKCYQTSYFDISAALSCVVGITNQRQME